MPHAGASVEVLHYETWRYSCWTTKAISRSLFCFRLIRLLTDDYVVILGWDHKYLLLLLNWIANYNLIQSISLQSNMDVVPWQQQKHTLFSPHFNLSSGILQPHPVSSFIYLLYILIYFPPTINLIQQTQTLRNWWMKCKKKEWIINGFILKMNWQINR